jgi:putative ABC transport system permease protein
MFSEGLKNVLDTIIDMRLWLTNFEVKKWLAAYLVMCVPMLIFWYSGLKLQKEIISASLRATLQLILIAVILVPVFKSGIFVQISLLVIMVFIGAFISAERGKGIPHRLPIAFFSIGVSFGFAIILFVVTGSLEVLPNIIIPISGMFIGNAVNSVSLNYHRTLKDFEEYRSTVEAMLIDGETVKEALKIPRRETLKTALIPKIDSLKTLGIVHIPGAMAGMMVAGADPLLAAGYQILIFFGIVSTASLASFSANYFSYKSVFNKYYPHLR